MEVTWADYDNNYNYYKNSIKIPETVVFMNQTRKVTSIGIGAFAGCYYLTSVTIPSSVTSIDFDAFADCYYLTSVTIPSSVETIGEGAFSGCFNLTSVSIPEGVMRIGVNAFYNCTSLTSVTIPSSVKWICELAFSWCSALTSVTIPEGVTGIGPSAFKNCTSLTSVTIPEGVTSIARETFYNCTSLTNVTIPSSVTSIGKSAFQNCKKLTSVMIGNGIKTIEAKAFMNCPNINDVYCLAYRYPKTNKDAFENSYPDYITLHVPDEVVEQYKAVEPWSSFKAVVGISGSTGATQVHANEVLIQSENGQVSVTGIDEGTAIAVYSADGKKIGSGLSQSGGVNIPTRLPAGSIAIVKIGDRSVKVVMK